jgi:hypothetical protein
MKKIECMKCHKTKPENEFPADYETFGNMCKDCMRIASNNRRMRQDAEARIRKTVVPQYRKYGLEPEQIAALLKQQNGICAICSKTGRLVLDHDHKTNKARGYVCPVCNILLAGLDNQEFLAKAQEYIKNPPAKQFYADSPITGETGGSTGNVI